MYKIAQQVDQLRVEMERVGAAMRTTKPSHAQIGSLVELGFVRFQIACVSL
jgi:hypothetical protein